LTYRGVRDSQKGGKKKKKKGETDLRKGKRGRVRPPGRGGKEAFYKCCLVEKEKKGSKRYGLHNYLNDRRGGGRRKPIRGGESDPT